MTGERTRKRVREQWIFVLFQTGAAKVIPCAVLSRRACLEEAERRALVRAFLDFDMSDYIRRLGFPSRPAVHPILAGNYSMSILLLPEALGSSLGMVMERMPLSYFALMSSFLTSPT